MNKILTMIAVGLLVPAARADQGGLVSRAGGSLASISIANAGNSFDRSSEPYLYLDRRKHPHQRCLFDEQYD